MELGEGSDPVKDKDRLIENAYASEKRAGNRGELSEDDKMAFSLFRTKLRSARESIAGEQGRPAKYKLARESINGPK